MDLRTIMNSDAGGANNAPPAAQSSIPSSEPSHSQRAPSNYEEYPARATQTALQHSQHTSPDRSSPYGSAQSPYQQFHAAPPPLNTAVASQSHRSPSHASTPYGPGARDPYGASAYNAQAHPQHPAAPLASPYTPMSAASQNPEQQSYFAQQRSHSLQSVMKTPRLVDVVNPRENSPSAPQPPPSHQLSSSAHRSVPGTPLGPPPALSSRQSPSPARPQSSGQDSPHNHLSSPRQMYDTHPRDSTNAQSPITQRQLSPSSRPSESTPRIHSAAQKPEPMDTSSPQPNSAAPSRSSEDRRWNESPTIPQHYPGKAEEQASPAAAAHSQMASSPSDPTGGPHPFKMAKIENERQSSHPAESQPPRVKRRRYHEPPIYAQRSTRNKGRDLVPAPAVVKHGAPGISRILAASSSSWRAPSANGPPPQPVAPSTPQPTALGMWEPSITGLIPHEEITKVLCDFLFQHVVVRNDVAVGPAGSAAAGQGTIIEIEAKLGHVIDADTRERLNLPVLTECVINRESPRFRTSFESNMTVEQHRAMNNFLNETVKASMPANNPNRVPVAYAHKRERDTFYEVNPGDLPPIIRQNLNPRHKPKVRVTTDQKTGEVIAKIIKCRVADIDVCSPRTTVDWRVSVNLEMEYEGDVSHLPLVDVSKGGRGERNKDRMSYRHLAYQVDLTQVARAELATKNEFEHELEIEVSAAEIRRQGNLALSGDPKNQYEDLVKGFVDNIRVLARAVPP
ncbi:hypothetical protein N7492_005636 [Penicillium capsulatum]|uniref:mRNA-capping enzyme subunit beta n=1 Tax=Penicillium capsulatum TaxID=69766 RepID=A0A9W9ICB7_9EURO|nr:hypothetical protein N7492_005636 [Penicillium capsulatum]